MSGETIILVVIFGGLILLALCIYIWLQLRLKRLAEQLRDLADKLGTQK